MARRFTRGRSRSRSYSRGRSFGRSSFRGARSMRARGGRRSGSGRQPAARLVIQLAQSSPTLVPAQGGTLAPTDPRGGRAKF